MIISLAELLEVGNGRLHLSVAIESIVALLTPKGTRATKKIEIIEAINYINDNRLWLDIDFNLLYFQGNLIGASLLFFSKDEDKTFIKNILSLHKKEPLILRNINNKQVADRLDFIAIHEQPYGINWNGKKKSILLSNTERIRIFK